MKQDTKKQVQNLKKFFKKKILSIINDKSELTVIFNQKDIIESLIQVLEEEALKIDEEKLRAIG